MAIMRVAKPLAPILQLISTATAAMTAQILISVRKIHMYTICFSKHTDDRPKT